MGALSELAPHLDSAGRLCQSITFIFAVKRSIRVFFSHRCSTSTKL
jgi:hypothetical protein